MRRRCLLAALLLLIGAAQLSYAQPALGAVAVLGFHALQPPGMADNMSAEPAGRSQA